MYMWNAHLIWQNVINVEIARGDYGTNRDVLSVDQSNQCIKILSNMQEEFLFKNKTTKVMNGGGEYLNLFCFVLFFDTVCGLDPEPLTQLYWC